MDVMRVGAEVGFAEGVCPNCGRAWCARRPASTVICDCNCICPLCNQYMERYNPDLDPSTYGPIEGWGAQGDVENPMSIVYRCPRCGYYSAQKPVEVILK